MKAALSLKELVWIETREHESINKFEPYVARTEVSLVPPAIRWSSHSFGEVKGFWTPRQGVSAAAGGLQPEPVAAQILAQCSGQLGA